MKDLVVIKAYMTMKIFKPVNFPIMQDLLEMAATAKASYERKFREAKLAAEDQLEARPRTKK